MRVKPSISSKSLGSPFAGSSGKPWHVNPPRGVIALIGLTVTIFFRRDFGERYLAPKALLKGAMILAIYAVGMRFYAGSGKIAAGYPVPPWSLGSWGIFVGLFLVYTSWQLFQAVRRHETFRDEYSYSDGRPRTFLFRFMPYLRDEWDFEQFYEPGICFLFGSFLLIFGNWFGLYLVIAAFCAFHVAKVKNHVRRELELDVLDGKVQSSTKPNFDAPPEDKAPVPFKSFQD